MKEIAGKCQEGEMNRELTVILMEWQEKLLKRCKTVANIAC